MFVVTQDHTAVRQRLSEFDTASSEAGAKLIRKLTDQLVRHEVGEQVVVYPALKELPGGSQVAEAENCRRRLKLKSSWPQWAIWIQKAMNSEPL